MWQSDAKLEVKKHFIKLIKILIEWVWNYGKKCIDECTFDINAPIWKKIVTINNQQFISYHFHCIYCCFNQFKHFLGIEPITWSVNYVT